ARAPPPRPPPPPPLAGARPLSGRGRRTPRAPAQADGAPDRYTWGPLARSAGARHADRQEVRRGADPIRVPRGHRPDRVRGAFWTGDREPSLMQAGVGG